MSEPQARARRAPEAEREAAMSVLDARAAPRAEAAREAHVSAPQARGAGWTERGTSEASAHLKRAEAARETL
jgi:hypothetical protein